MNWKLKSLVCRHLSRLPARHTLGYWLQRCVTKSLPTGTGRCAEIVRDAVHHLESLRRHGQTPIERAVFFEFGAGSELTIPLAYWACGVSDQVLVDLFRLLRPELVDSTLQELAADGVADLLQRRPPITQAPRSAPQLDAWLRDHFGIRYLAPADARQTSLSAGSIDYITSTNTLEHIPPEDIRLILIECRRLLKDNGVMSFSVDYQDHYAYADATVTVYNFLQYSDREWFQRHSPALHYQNRLRHIDYVHLYRDTGFEIVTDEPHGGSSADLNTLKSLPIHERFKKYPWDELAVRSARTVLRKRGSVA